LPNLQQINLEIVDVYSRSVRSLESFAKAVKHKIGQGRPRLNVIVIDYYVP
jgi:hypothetical protein